MRRRCSRQRRSRLAARLSALDDDDPDDEGGVSTEDEDEDDDEAGAAALHDDEDEDDGPIVPLSVPRGGEYLQFLVTQPTSHDLFHVAVGRAAPAMLARGTRTGPPLSVDTCG